MNLSIIINNLNDHDECNETIRSIVATAPFRYEIVVVDDFSNIPFSPDSTLSRHALNGQVLHVHRTDHRMGCGGSRHFAAEKAKGEYLFFIDSHMRFLPGWFEAAAARIVGRPDTAHCAVCLGLGDKYCSTCKQPMSQEEGKDVCQTCKGTEHYPNMDVTKPCAVYTGATMNIYGQDPNNPALTQIFEGIWKDHPVDDCELPCMMGACYFLPRELFFRVGGLNALRKWGLDEPYLSLKVWLAGGEIRLIKGVRIGHKFREKSPYSVDISALYYNKIRCLLTCMSQEESSFLISRMQRDIHFAQAMNLIMGDRPAIQSEREFNLKAFKRDLKWYCSEKFPEIKYPLS